MKKQKAKTILLIDGENLLHRSFHKFENLKSSDGKPSGAIYGFFKSLHSYLVRFNPYKVMVVFDNGRSHWRTDILRYYKGNRINLGMDYESFKNQKKLIMAILRMLRINYIFDKEKTSNFEGDDFLAYLYLTTRSSNNPRYKFVLVSTDKDFTQLLGYDFRILNPQKDMIVTDRNCSEVYGWSPKETVDYLCLVGDESDNIKGYRGIGPVKARQLLDKYGSIKEACDENSDIEHAIKGVKIDKKTLKRIYKRNKSLIDLKWFIRRHNTVPVHDYIRYYNNKNLQIGRFNKICDSYSFKSFMTNEFISVFKNLLTTHETD